MKILLTATAALSLLLAPLAVEAGPKGRGNGNGNGNGNGHGNGHGAWADGDHCPPGLAHRDPPCVPPGQARHRDRDREEEREAERAEEAREDAADWAAEVIEARDDEDDRDRNAALAVLGALAGTALLQQAQREPQPAATVVEPATAPFLPSTFSFSEVPSRPASIETLAAAPAWGDAADPEPFLTLTEPAPVPATVPRPTPAIPPAPILAPSPSRVIPPPPPMAEDVTDLLGGGTTAATGY